MFQQIFKTNALCGAWPFNMCQHNDQPSFIFFTWWTNPPVWSPRGGGDHRNNRRSYVGSEMRVLRRWAASGRDTRGRRAPTLTFSAWQNSCGIVFFFSCRTFVHVVAWLCRRIAREARCLHLSCYLEEEQRRMFIFYRCIDFQFQCSRFCFTNCVLCVDISSVGWM